MKLTSAAASHYGIQETLLIRDRSKTTGFSLENILARFDDLIRFSLIKTSNNQEQSDDFTDALQKSFCKTFHTRKNAAFPLVVVVSRSFDRHTFILIDFD